MTRSCRYSASTRGSTCLEISGEISYAVSMGGGRPHRAWRPAAAGFAAVLAAGASVASGWSGVPTPLQAGLLATTIAGATCVVVLSSSPTGPHVAEPSQKKYSATPKGPLSLVR
jgi:hypothetical protein